MAGDRCARCNRDISMEAFKYEGEAGEILCEDCFNKKTSQAPRRAAGYAFLRVVSVFLKVLAVVSLIGGAGLAHLHYAYSKLLAVESIVSGIIIFLMCMVISELIRLGLTIYDKLDSIANNTNSLLGSARKEGNWPFLSAGAGKGEYIEKRG